MIPQEQLDQSIKTMNRGRKSTMAEFLVSLFKDKFVEIYLGDAYEEVKTEQVTTTYPTVFSGKIIGAYKECLILEACAVDTQTKSLKLKKQIFINERAIRGLCEIDGAGIMDDIFLRSRDAHSNAKIGQ
jgi:hypothetical protein